MSAPPMGMMIRMPNSRATAVTAQNSAGSPPDWLKQPDEPDQQRGERKVDQVPQGQDDRLARHAARQLGKGDHRAREGDGADGDAERHLEQARACDGIRLADAERLGGIEGAGGHEHRGEAHQRVERGHQLGHRRHRHAARDDGADAAAEQEPAGNQCPGQLLLRRADLGERGADGERHAEHAEQVAAARGLRARQPAQRHDEEHRSEEIEQGDEVGAHGFNISVEPLGNSTPANSGYTSRRICSCGALLTRSRYHLPSSSRARVCDLT